MAENEQNKEQEQEPKAAEPRVKVKLPKKKSRVGGIAVEILDGSFLTRDLILTQLPFLYFMMALSMLYIANNYYAEKTFKETRNVETELKELRSEYITVASELMNESKQSAVAKKVESIGIKESTVPPKKIIVKVEELKKLLNN